MRAPAFYHSVTRCNILYFSLGGDGLGLEFRGEFHHVSSISLPTMHI